MRTPSAMMMATESNRCRGPAVNPKSITAKLTVGDGAIRSWSVSVTINPTLNRLIELWSNLVRRPGNVAGPCRTLRYAAEWSDWLSMALAAAVPQAHRS